MGYQAWHACDRLLRTIADTTGIDIKRFDNKYHCAIMNGAEVQSHRYSEACKEILEKVRSGEEYIQEVEKEAEAKGQRN